MMPGVTARLKSVSLKVTKLPTPVVVPFSGSTSRQPITPPKVARSRDSAKKLVRMLKRENPRTRRVPISFERRATAAYIVFIAAKALPIAMMTATKVPRYRSSAPDEVCFS